MTTGSNSRDTIPYRRTRMSNSVYDQSMISDNFQVFL